MSKPEFSHRNGTEGGAPVHYILLQLSEAQLIMLLAIAAQGINAPLPALLGPKATHADKRLGQQSRLDLIELFQEIAQHIRITHPKTAPTK